MEKAMVIFFIITFINVILSTVKSILTVKTLEVYCTNQCNLLWFLCYGS